MEKDSNYLEIYEPALQSTVMRVACEHLGKTVKLNTPLPSVCNKLDMAELFLGFEMEFDMDIIEEDNNIKTLNDIVELIRVQFSEEELKNRLNNILMRRLNSYDDDEPEYSYDDDEPESENEMPIASNPTEDGACNQEAISDEEQQMMDEIMNYLSDSDNDDDLDRLLDIFEKHTKQ